MAEELQIRLTADIKDLKAKLAEAKKEIAGFERRGAEFGEKLTKIGKRLSVGITLPLTALGAAALKMSTDFNAAMANVATLIPGNIERIKELKEEIQALAVETGKSATDLANGLYQVISAIGDSADSMEILRVAAKSATAGVSSTRDAVNLLAAVTKGYGDTSAEAAKKAADLAFMTVKLGQTTFPELASAIGRVVPLAAALHVKQEELFAGFATLTGVTGDTAEVSTQLAAVLRAMIKPTTAMRDAIHSLGYQSAEAMIKELGLVGAMRKIIATTDGSQEAIAKLFNRAEALTAVFALTGGQADTFNKKLRELEHSAGATEVAFKEQADGINKTGFTWKQFRIQLELVAEKLGDALAPAFASVLKVASAALDIFNKLPQPLKTITVVAGGLAAAVGPLTMAFGSFLKMIPSIVAGLRSMSLSFGLVTTAIVAVGTGLNMLINKWKEHMSEEIAAIAGNQKVNDTWRALRTEMAKQEGGLKRLSEVWKKYGGDVQAALQAIAEGKEGEELKAKLDEIKQKVEESSEAAPEFAKSFQEAMTQSSVAAEQFDEEFTEAVQRGTELRKQLQQDYFNSMIAMIEEFGGAQAEVLEPIEEQWTGMVNNINAAVAQLVPNQMTTLGNLATLWGTMGKLISLNWSAANNKLREVAKSTTTTIKQFWVKMRGAIEENVKNFVDSIGNAFGRLGTNIVRAFEAIWKKGEKFTDKLKEAFKEFARSTLDALENLVGGIIASAIKTVLAKKIEAIASVIASVMASVPFPLNLAIVGGAIAAVAGLFSMLHLAEGGLVTKPAIATVAEREPELVVPLSRVDEVLGGVRGGDISERIEIVPLPLTIQLGDMIERFLIDFIPQATKEERLLIHKNAVKEFL